ncbi:uncharacterized protein LOC129592775 [Paramacrobiotus metropolitanus]|uniref:uncharacterized protein LOC129592775 n=1 Tax=Paramacrobiotus metropolitanus TaxID=2943436 RepID=UPI002445DBF8|nr:uncharacterized protein LOC129592775 [Paramacrobiotus metropolitanus]
MTCAKTAIKMPIPLLQRNHLRSCLILFSFLIFGLLKADCPSMPTDACYLDCSQNMTYRVVCEDVTGNGLHNNLALFAGLNASFELYIWNSPSIDLLGGNIFSDVEKLITGLHLQNVVNLYMFPEVSELVLLRELVIQNAPKLKYLPMDLMPMSVEIVVIEQTGITQFINDRTSAADTASNALTTSSADNPPTEISTEKWYNVSDFTIRNQRIEFLSGFFRSFPNIQTITATGNHIVFTQPHPEPFATENPLRRLYVADNTFESTIPGFQLQLFHVLITSIKVNASSAVELVNNDFPIGKHSVKEFSRISAIQRLSLRGSLFEDYNTLQGIFRDFTNLKYLDLGHTDLPDLKAGVFANLPNLQELRLDGNRLRMLGSVNIFEGLQANNLSFLDMSNNELNNMPQGYEAFGPNLISFDLTGNKLSSRTFPNKTQYFTKLMNVSLADNKKASFVSESFSKFLNLRKLDMSCNTFINITSTYFIGLPDSLRTLNLSSCGVAERKRPVIMKDAFKTFPINLETLVIANAYLRSNIFTKLQYIPRKERLLGLHLQGNKIAYLPRNSSYFEAFAGLQQLYLNNNTLQSIGSNAFRGLRNLTELNLADNSIFAIKSQDFAGLDSLISLNLARNHILIIDKYAFDVVPTLQALILGSNNINYITDLFSKNKADALIHLDISNMPVPCLDPKFFVLYRNLKWLYMNGSISVLVDMDTKLNVNQQKAKYHVHRWADKADCRTPLSSKYLPKGTVNYMMIQISDPKQLVYQDLFAHFEICYVPGKRNIKNVTNVIC